MLFYRLERLPQFIFNICFFFLMGAIYVPWRSEDSIGDSNLILPLV